jgi:hypothetical protein
MNNTDVAWCRLRKVNVEVDASYSDIAQIAREKECIHAPKRNIYPKKAYKDVGFDLDYVIPKMLILRQKKRFTFTKLSQTLVFFREQRTAPMSFAKSQLSYK